jgi:hypothetical protein
VRFAERAIKPMTLLAIAFLIVHGEPTYFLLVHRIDIVIWKTL